MWDPRPKKRKRALPTVSKWREVRRRVLEDLADDDTNSDEDTASDAPFDADDEGVDDVPSLPDELVEGDLGLGGEGVGGSDGDNDGSDASEAASCSDVAATSSSGSSLDDLDVVLADDDGGFLEAPPRARTVCEHEVHLPDYMGCGSIVLYKSGEVYAICRDPRHGLKCRVSRQRRPNIRFPAQGRPIGFLVSWLMSHDEFEDDFGHKCKDNCFDHSFRKVARSMFSHLPGAALMLECERDKLDDEESEPEEQP